MAIEQKEFDNEQELQNWIELHISDFYGDVIFIPGNFFISTRRNKGGKPDGFILDLQNSSWTIVETELLHHGVWNHIAEQIIRFIVASKNDSSQRKIRDIFFDEIENRSLISKLSKQMNISEPRLIQRIETIIESQTPDIAIFIDKINEDLIDMIEALNATIKVFKVQKYNVNGKIEYLSPDGNKSSIETTIEEVRDTQGNQIEALDLMGGGKFEESFGNIKFYKLENSDKVSLKYSKTYENDPPYWYGITPSTMEKYRKGNMTHLGFIMGDYGVLKLPIDILEEYISKAKTSNKPDETIRHYHIFIKAEPKVILYTNKNTKKWEVDDYFYRNE